MEKFIKNIQEVFTTEEKNESGEFAANVIFMGLLLVAAIAIGGWVVSGLNNQGANLAECLNQANAVGINTDNNCDDIDTSSNKDFKDSDTYSNRFGG